MGNVGHCRVRLSSKGEEQRVWKVVGEEEDDEMVGSITLVVLLKPRTHRNQAEGSTTSKTVALINGGLGFLRTLV